MAHGYSTRAHWFVDPAGRHTLLRGFNLGGSTKVPFAPDGATHLGVDFDGWRDVSFIGRPAPLDDIDEHLDRIAHWGANVLRLLTTWEAIEHAGPGLYDEAYLDYLREVARRAGERGLLVFLDPHHDVWSRFTGGDGAPYWCFELAGLRADRFVAADAVTIDAFDWPAGYVRVPVATMWTLFFAGDRYCPELTGVGEQLQSHYVGALTAAAERLGDLDNVLGYDTFNEPSYGYVGLDGEALARPTRMFDRGDDPRQPFSAVELLAAADGVTVRHDDGGVVNPDGISIWEDGCPWRRLGVWDLDADGRPVVTAPDHFTTFDDRPVASFTDLVAPFARRVREAVRAVQPDAFVFLEGSPMDFSQSWDDPDPLVVDARHWYDITVLGTRRCNPDEYTSWFAREPLHGVDAIADHYTDMLAPVAEQSHQRMSGRPLLFGEYGIPYEMNDGHGFRTGDYSAHEALLEATYRAMDRLAIHGTQWNYTADNTHAHGDQWNDEDLSVYSADDRTGSGGLDDGGRAVRGFCRPRLLHAAGEPTAMAFDPVEVAYELEVDVDGGVAAPTEVFAPVLWYPAGIVAEVTGGRAEVDAEHQRVVWDHAGTTGPQRLVLRPA